MDWELPKYNHNVELKKPTNGIWKFNFPNKDGVHMVVKPVKGGKLPARIKVELRITGTNPAFTAVQKGPGAQAKLYFQREGDDWAGLKGTSEFFRWWSIQPLVLKVGTGILEVPVAAKFWQSVNGVTGNDAVDKFKDAWLHRVFVGITFGGEIDAGHGVFDKNAPASKSICKLMTFNEVK